MRKPVIAGNWKMNKTISEALELVNDLKIRMTDVDDVTIVVCPTFLCIKSVADALEGSNVHVGAQDMFWETSGAYTAEVSGEMILEAGAEYVIIGHSERRQYFGETNETVNKKVKKALALGLKPIVCVGEMLEDREAGNTEKVVDDHLTNGLAGVSADDMKKIIVAYEPVWAIGTGVTASPEQAQEMHRFIRELIRNNFGEEIASQTTILYGGSCNAKNASTLFANPDVDGGLIGGASLKADDFVEIICSF